MAEKRKVLIDSISYLGTDGEMHVARRGDTITVAKAGVEHFDWIHGSTPEARHAEHAAAVAAADRATTARRRPTAPDADPTPDAAA